MYDTLEKSNAPVTCQLEGLKSIEQNRMKKTEKKFLLQLKANLLGMRICHSYCASMYAFMTIIVNLGLSINEILITSNSHYMTM